MKKYKLMQTEERFKRQTGISKENFEHLCSKVESYVKAEKERNPFKKRGKNKSRLSQEDRILLTIYYLRHYPTFANLADIFDISESYCYKIYSSYSQILVKVETLPNRKELLENPPTNYRCNRTTNRTPY